MDTDNDVPQAKASRQQQKVSHEYCQGYVDKNGMWNNGFYCRRWGGPDETYCCGDGRERFCCPEQTSATSQATSTSAASFIPIIVGVSVGLLVVIVCLLIGCFLCPSCPGFKRRRRNKAPVPIVIGRTLSVSMEAEATSAVIAAQALVPLQQQQSACHSSSSPSGGGQGSSTTTVADDGHLHCGCRWSPNDTSSTTVDIDSLVASLYQSTTSAWQPELDNFYNYSCEVRPSCSSRDATLRKEALRQQHQHQHQHQQHQQQHQYQQQQQQTSCSRLQQASSRLNSHRLMGSNHQSPLCLQSYRANSSSATRDSSDESKPTSLERGVDNKTQQPSSLRRTYGLPEHIRSAGGSSGGGGTGRDAGGPSGAMLLESDRQRRDSGVLVEDQDTTGSGNSMLALNIPAIELTSITRQLDYNSLDRRTTTTVVRQH